MAEREMIFGTDGVRDRAGEGYLAPASVRRIARAIDAVLRQRERFPEELGEGRGDVVYVARDTRASGPELLDIVSSELRSIGRPVADLGVLPTGGAALVARSAEECALAVVLSASHNPAEYNGIKLIAPVGAKVSPDLERAVSEAWHDIDPASLDSPAGAAQAPLVDLADASLGAYRDALVGMCRRPERLRGRRVVIDTAHGAASRVAAETFRALGLEVLAIGDAPDGSNINDGYGALHADRLAAYAQQEGACLGFSFDGDADRMIPVTGAGRVLDGDWVLALAARAYHRDGLLPNGAVVATVMSNLGLAKSLAERGLRLIRTPVGDRHVYLELLRGGHPFGGEQSGHLIFVDDLPTGDGLLAAIRLLDVLESDELDLEAESAIMTRFPQILKGLTVDEKVPLERLPEVSAVIAEVEAELGADGRVVVRYSGTEPLLRVMIEGPDRPTIEDRCERILDAARGVLVSPS